MERNPERLPEPYLISKSVPLAWRKYKDTDVQTTDPIPNLVTGGATSVVLVVEQTGDVGEVALLAGDPEVAGAGVEHYLEGLWRGSDGDGTVVLSIHVVREGFRLKSCGLKTPSMEGRIE